METIIEVFTSIQVTKNSHKLNIKKLSSLFSKSKKHENFSLFLHCCVDKILIHQKSNMHVSLATDFICSLIPSLDDELLTLSMKHICSRIASSNKLVRQKVCQMIAAVLEQMTLSNGELSSDLINELTGSLLPRLNDKIPTVRHAAVLALKLLQDPSDPSDVCTKEIVRLMISDSSVTVRLTAVKIVTLFEDNSVHLCSRLRDTKSEIRIAAMERLAASLDVRSFKARVRSEIIKLCLTDREEAVRAAGRRLVMAWLSKLTENNGFKHEEAVPKLLSLVNPLNVEEVVLLLGSTVVEELTRDVLQQHSEKLKQAVTAKGVIDWRKGLTAVTPSDIMWVYIRGNYARRSLPVLAATEMCDSILPCGPELEQLLSEARSSTDLHTNTKKQFVVKYLLRICVLVSAGSSSEAQQLRSRLLVLCEELLADRLLTVDVMEPVLKTIAAMRVSDSRHSSTTTESLLVVVRGLQRCASDSADVGDATAAVQYTAKSLQILYWLLQQEVGSLGGAAGGEIPVHLTDMVDFAIKALQQPVAGLRSLALGCLGLLSLMSVDVCQEHRHIFVQVASGGFEEDVIREQAVKCLADLACVHKAVFHDDSDLCNILLRIQDSNDGELVLVAGEGAAKLLFAGVLGEPGLFSNLLKFFFLSDSLPQEADDAAADGEPAASSRLQQILSIFFQAFMVSEGRCERVALESISQLVADMTSSIKFSDAKTTSLHTVIKHLLALCENIQLGAEGDAVAGTTLQSLIKERAFSAVLRELLKLGNSKIDKTVTKEFVKMLDSLSLAEWITAEKVSKFLSEQLP